MNASRLLRVGTATPPLTDRRAAKLFRQEVCHDALRVLLRHGSAVIEEGWSAVPGH
jgi:hypothetical protein